MLISIYIKNFKSILEDEITLPRYGAVVGLNAAGKTNLIQAIALMKNLVNGEDIEEALEKITLTRRELFNYHNHLSNGTTLKLKVQNGDEFCYSLEININIKNDLLGLPKAYITYEQLSREKDDNTEVIYSRSENNLIKGSGEPIPLDVDDSKLAVNLYKENDAQAFKSIISKLFITETDVMNLRDSIVNQEQEGLASLLIRIRHKEDQSDYQLFQRIIKKLLPSFSSVVEMSASRANDPVTEKSDEKKLYVVLLEEKNLKGTLSMQSISAGDLKTLYLIANVVNLKPGSTFITEEIENGLHPKRIKDVLDHLDQIARQKNIQLLFTTHSPAIINTLRASEVLWARKEEDMGSRYSLLSESRHVTMIEKLLKEGGQLTDLINLEVQ